MLAAAAPARGDRDLVVNLFLVFLGFLALAGVSVAGLPRGAVGGHLAQSLALGGGSGDVGHRGVARVATACDRLRPPASVD